jgi:hypothetical protein
MFSGQQTDCGSVFSVDAIRQEPRLARMTMTSNQNGLIAGASKIQFSMNMRCFAGLVVVAVLMAAWGARADAPDDEYLTIYMLIQQADALSTNGPPGSALAKYQQAQTALRNFQKSHPDWNVKTVSYRLNYLADKIAGSPDKAGSTARGGTAASMRDAGPAPQVKLLEAGAEPRTVLRLHPKAGDKQTLGVTMKMAMDVKVENAENPAIKLPPMLLTMDVTVKAVSSEGDITYDMVMSDASVGDEPDVVPQVADAMKSSLARMRGLSSAGTTSSRGFNKGIDIKMPPGADAQTRQALDQMKEAFSSASAPLPAEAVGAGARWEVKMTLKSQGLAINQTTTYQLASIEGEKLTLSSTLVQTASNQKIQNPAMPTLKLDLSKLAGTGTGTMTFDLTQLMPAEAVVESHTDMSMAMNTGGQKQNMTMKMDMNVRLETK